MVQLFGRITKDAVVNVTKEEKKVVNFSIALNDSYKKKDGELKEFVTYVNCAYWVRPESATYLTKGKLVEVIGRLEVNAYSNMKGDAVGTLNFHVNTFRLYGKGSSENQVAENVEKGKRKNVRGHAEEITAPVDDLPF